MSSRINVSDANLILAQYLLYWQLVSRTTGLVVNTYSAEFNLDSCMFSTVSLSMCGFTIFIYERCCLHTYYLCAATTRQEKWVSQGMSSTPLSGLNHHHHHLFLYLNNQRHLTSLNPRPQCLRFRPESFPSMPCWYCISSCSLIFLSSCPAEETQVTTGTPGQYRPIHVWIDLSAGVEWGRQVNCIKQMDPAVWVRGKGAAVLDICSTSLQKLQKTAHHCGSEMWTCGRRWRGARYVPSGKQNHSQN